MLDVLVAVANNVEAPEAARVSSAGGEPYEQVYKLQT